jgi:hypothetical protein
VRTRAVLASVAALAVAGCGSKPLSNGELQRQATRVCTQAGARTDRLPTPGSPAGTIAFVRRAVAVMSPELAALKGLKPPGDVADVYSTAIDAFTKKLTALKDSVRDLRGGADPVIAIKTLQQQLGPLESQEDGAWQALAIPACLNR